MSNLFLILLLLSFLGLVIGLISPSVLKFGSRKAASLSMGGATLVFFILFGVVTPTTPKESVAVSATTTPVATKPAETAQTATVSNNSPTKAKTAPTTASAPVQATPTQSAPTDREKMLVILKSNASAKWGDNYQMVKFEYDEQVKAYDWVMAQTKYSNIMANAMKKWGNNFQMVKFEYEQQVEAYESL